MNLATSWNNVDQALLALAEHRGTDEAGVAVLSQLGLAAQTGEQHTLTPLGERYYMARFVVDDDVEVSDTLADILSHQAVPTAFCGALWGSGDIPVSGAVSLLRRLGVDNEQSTKRWLELMNKAGWIAYNRKNPTLRISFNPGELTLPDQQADRERGRGHLVSPDTPYGNLLALRELVRAARNSVRWYEREMPAKVLEVLYREIDGALVSEIRLLSGPANVDKVLNDDFKRFAKEMKGKRGVSVSWRVLTRKDAFRHHDRFFLSEKLARNLPPVNTILANSTGEILPSDLTTTEFDEWWDCGVDLRDFRIDAEVAVT